MHSLNMQSGSCPQAQVELTGIWPSAVTLWYKAAWTTEKTFNRAQEVLSGLELLNLLLQNQGHLDTTIPLVTHSHQCTPPTPAPTRTRVNTSLSI